MVMNCMLVSRGRLAMYTTCSATWLTSNRGSALTSPVGCRMPRSIGAVMSVAALPMSIWLQAMLYLRPSSEVAFLGQARHAVLGGGVRGAVGARHVGGDGAVVDNAPAHGVLVFHDPEGLLCTQEGARKVGVDHGHPLLEGQVLHVHRRRGAAGVVEQHVEATTEGLAGAGEQIGHRLRAADVGGHGDRAIPVLFGLGPPPPPGLPPASRSCVRQAPPSEPSRNSASADARPTPEPAPVTMATRPSEFIGDLLGAFARRCTPSALQTSLTPPRRMWNRGTDRCFKIPFPLRERVRVRVKSPAA